MKTTYLLCLVFSCFGINSQEQIKHWSPLTVERDEFDPSSKTMRIKYAAALLQEVKAIHSAIPSLSPDQQKWLASERERIEQLKDDPPAQLTARVTLVSSKEYRLESTKLAFKNLRTVLEGIAAFEDSNRPLQAWILVGYFLTDSDAYQHLNWLEQHHFIKLPKVANYLRNPTLAHEAGRTILKRIAFELAQETENAD